MLKYVKILNKIWSPKQNAPSDVHVDKGKAFDIYIGIRVIDSFSVKLMCSMLLEVQKKECLLIDSTFCVLNICKLCLYRGNNCLPFCRFVLYYVNILLQCHSTNAVINSLSTATSAILIHSTNAVINSLSTTTSAILIASCKLENLLVNGKLYVQPCFPLLQISWWHFTACKYYMVTLCIYTSTTY